MKTLYFFLLVFISSNLIGQNSVVEFQFGTPTFDCATDQVCYPIQVRANTPMQPDGNIEFADAQYRIYYPANIMNFSNLLKQN